MIQDKKNTIASQIPPLVFSGLLVAYICGYSHARHEHWIIHRAGMRQGMVDMHELSPGDFSSPILRGVYHIYWPMRKVETIYWYISNPIGNDWPYWDE